MNDEATQEMGYRLAIQQGVEEHLNRLVVNARELIDEFLKKEEGEGRQWNMGPTQMSNLLSVCGETGSVEVVVGYIQYQIGRDDKDRNWAWWDFGEALIERLRALQPQAHALVSKALQKTGHALDDGERRGEEDQIWMLLVCQYVGHLCRYFTYKRPKGE
jgi:hypothetical protein